MSDTGVNNKSKTINKQNTSGNLGTSSNTGGNKPKNTSGNQTKNQSGNSVKQVNNTRPRNTLGNQKLNQSKNVTKTTENENTLAENLSELLSVSSNNDITGLGLNNDIKSSTNNKGRNQKPTLAQSLVSGTESVIQTAANKISEVRETVTDRLGELQEGSNLGMNLLKIVITILILVALFFVVKYLFTRYQDSIYSSPYLLDGTKNAKHALVISQDPDNPSYIPMPKSDNQASLQFTYDFWLLIDSYEYKKGEWKHVFHKGNSSSYPNRAPGIWLHPDTNAMRIYMNTQDNILEYVDVDNLPLRKWIHVSLVLHDMDMDVFINGYLKKRQKLTSVPKLNNGDFWINMFGGFEGYLARIRYYARAISVDEITNNVSDGPGHSACIETGQTPPYLDDDWWISS